MTARDNVSLGRETLRHALGLGGPLDFDIVDALEQPPIEVDDAEANAPGSAEPATVLLPIPTGSVT